MQYLMILALLGLGCSSPKPIEGVVRPNPGEPLLQRLPGPMPDFGSFDSFSDALLAACPLILSKPNATAGRAGDQDFQLRWRIASEYCAWLYYTPEHKYEMSMLTDQHKLDVLYGKKSCVLPSYVEDPRYPPDSLKYIFALHNHPTAAPSPRTTSDSLSPKEQGTDLKAPRKMEICASPSSHSSRTGLRLHHVTASTSMFPPPIKSSSGPGTQVDGFVSRRVASTGKMTGATSPSRK
jgi:hypothetical protein